MPLLGSAAMLLSFDIDAEGIDEHDRWHTHEHLLERLSIPGFRRGTRWIACKGGPRYMVVYEVEDLATLASKAYLDRLNNPTPWTRQMMPLYRGMTRGLCTVRGSFGFGQGGTAALIRFAVEGARRAGLDDWLLEAALPSMPAKVGVGSAHYLEGAQAADMTNEQRIRGADRGIDAALILTGYDEAAVVAAATTLSGDVATRGGIEPSCFIYRLSYSLASAEIDS